MYEDKELNSGLPCWLSEEGMLKPNSARYYLSAKV